jgi:hypothetical protein
MSRPSLPLTGGCSCGAIRYEVTAFPFLLCQTASGSAFALNLPVASRSFRIVKGEPKGWHHHSPSGVAVVSWFCADCGARLYGERAGWPEVMNVRAGTLDDTRWLTPVGHMFMKSAQGWVVPAEGAECFEADADDFIPLARKWRAMWPEFFPPAA